MHSGFISQVSFGPRTENFAIKLSRCFNLLVKMLTYATRCPLSSICFMLIRIYLVSLISDSTAGW